MLQSIRRIQAIALKELRQLRRDRLTFGMVVMIPLIQLCLFGYAINTDVRHVHVGVVDQSQTHLSRQIVAKAQASQVVNVIASYPDTFAAEKAIAKGEIRAALFLPRDLTRRALQQKPLGQWIIDGSDTMVANTILALEQMPIGDAAQSAPPFEMVLFYNPERRSAVNIVPGLLGVILTMTMVLFTSVAIVREREHGNLELLITTPMHSLELMIAKILPYIAIGYVQIGIILGLGHLLFDVPIRGDLTQIALAGFYFICASLTLGLIISTVAQTQMQAMQMTVFILLPSILLSGFMFPLEAMPTGAQFIAELLPNTHFTRLIRGVVLRGIDASILSPDAIWLLGFCLVGLVIATLRFKKRLD
ncbi:ABC transporter permease [Vibrio stylophorae]|nr:ABC transporter permease [Vibrio stylophorae]